jgi:large-conductance mechanosensitive channel
MKFGTFAEKVLIFLILTFSPFYLQAFIDKKRQQAAKFHKSIDHQSSQVQHITEQST